MISTLNDGTATNRGNGQGHLLQPDRFARWAWVWAYGAVVTTLAVVRHSLYVVHGYSLSGYLAAFSLITHGRPEELLTNPLTRAIASNHSWIIWILAPLVSVLGAGFLFFFSALVVGSGALALYRVGQLWQLEPRTSAIISSLYLLYPSLIAANIYDFHPEVWAASLLLWLVWFALKKNWWGFGIMLVLMTGLGIPVAGALMLTGIGLLLSKKSVWFGATDLTFTVLYWSLEHGGLIFPHWAWTGRLSLRTVLYLMWVLLPPSVAAVTLFRRRSALNHWWLLAGVVLAWNIAQGSVADTSPFTDHSALLAPFGAMALLASGTIFGRFGKWALLWSTGWVVLMGGYLYHSTWRPRPANGVEIAAALSLVPKSSLLVSQSYILPHRGVTDRNWPTTVITSRIIPNHTYVLLNPEVSDGYSTSPILTAWLNIAKSPAKSRIRYHAAGVWLFQLTRPLPPQSLGG
ncbi:MAG: DUF2079 domain-containing protein [Firmicutes bacterium]|jgi:hypothetical protein|nr:DUF2079 domain-containing protein [Bacillota bacterium]